MKAEVEAKLESALGKTPRAEYVAGMMKAKLHLMESITHSIDTSEDEAMGKQLVVIDERIEREMERQWILDCADRGLIMDEAWDERGDPGIHDKPIEEREDH